MTIQRCPFCGGRASFRSFPGCVWVACDACHVETRASQNESDAIRIWNLRAEAAQPAESAGPEGPVDPEGDATYWRARAEDAEAKLARAGEGGK
jgi:Lar family restriction alleviation protein